MVALHVVAWELCKNQRRVLCSRPGGECFGADLDRIPSRNAIPGVLELVVGVLPNLLSTVGVLVAEGSLGAQRLDIVEVVGGAGRNGFVSGTYVESIRPVCFRRRE
jgi:hypothetical protein